MTDKQPNLGIDGYPRKKQDDEKISQDVLALFNSPSGQEVLKYLRSITIDVISGANISDNELRHLEGQRYLVDLIIRRMNHATSIKSKDNE